MTAENNVNELKQPKFWALWQIFVAAFCATPIAGCYFMSRNYNLLKLEKQAKTVLIMGILINLILLPICSLILAKILPKAPNIIIPVAFASSIYQYAKYTQASGLQRLKDTGFKRYSFLSWLWRCLILLIIGAVLSSICIVPLIYFNVL